MDQRTGPGGETGQIIVTFHYDGRESSACSDFICTQKYHLFLYIMPLLTAYLSCAVLAISMSPRKSGAPAALLLMSKCCPWPLSLQDPMLLPRCYYGVRFCNGTPRFVSPSLQMTVTTEFLNKAGGTPPPMALVKRVFQLFSWTRVGWCTHSSMFASLSYQSLPSLSTTEVVASRLH